MASGNRANDDDATTADEAAASAGAAGDPVEDTKVGGTPATAAGDPWPDEDPLDERNAPAGTLVQAPAEPVPDILTPDTSRPGALRRRRRELARRRQRALLDLGGLVVEMARRERMRVDLLAHRAAIVRTLDSELDAVDAALRSPQARRPGELLPPAPDDTMTTCANCGADLAVSANYCANCGTSVLTDEAAERVVAQ